MDLARRVDDDRRQSPQHTRENRQNYPILDAGADDRLLLNQLCREELNVLQATDTTGLVTLLHCGTAAQLVHQSVQNRPRSLERGTWSRPGSTGWVNSTG